MKIFCALSILFLSWSVHSKLNLEKEDYREKIRDNLHLFRGCYEEELKNYPRLEGRVVVAWEIDNSGSVKNAKVKESTLKSPAVENCMLKIFTTLKFPKPPPDYSATVIYPFVFTKGR